MSAMDIEWMRTNWKCLSSVVEKCNHFRTISEQPGQTDWVGIGVDKEKKTPAIEVRASD
jgi:hypothetical protein